MIISRTPLRVSFCGGGSDLPAFYREYGGAVLSMSITRYVYLSMHDYFESDGFILKYSQLERPTTLDEIKHRIVRQVFADYGIKGVDFNSSADVPAGTGIVQRLHRRPAQLVQRLSRPVRGSAGAGAQGLRDRDRQAG